MTTTWNDIAVGTLYTDDLNHDVNVATIQAQLEGIYGSGLVSVTPNTDFIIAFEVSIGESGLVADFNSLVGATDPALTITTEYLLTPLVGQNAGTKPCNAEIEIDIQEDAEDLKVTLAETGQYIELDRAVTAGETIVVNTKNRTLTVDGEDAREDITFSSRWFMLPVGTFTVSVEPNNAHMTITYRQRWI